MNSVDPYGSTYDFGLLYDQVPAYATRGDVAFYVSEADRLVGANGSVLEVGCGTGRVLLPIARAGHSVFGIDPSTAMLARFSEKLERESEDVRSRVRLMNGDARAFDVIKPSGRHIFNLAIAPFRIFQHITTVADQLACLQSIRRHLDAGSHLIFDVFNPNYSLLAKDRSEEFEDTPEFLMPDGRYLRRMARVTKVHWLEQYNDVDLIFYVRSASDVQRYVQSIHMRWYGVAELEHLLARSGFTVEVLYGNFDQSPLTFDSPEIIVVAKTLP